MVALTIHNAGPVSTNSWRLMWTFADDQVIVNLFGGVHRQIGPDVTVDSLSWSAQIPPGATFIGLGFYASWDNVSNSVPVVTCLTT